MQEIWKDIPNYEGLYQASNFGRIKSIQYFNHANNKIYPREKILKPILNEKGYCRVDLSKSGESKRHRVHRLVAKTFLPNPYNLLEVNHIDGNKQNNNVNNLEWCSRSHNMKEACKLGLVIPPKRTKKHNNN